MVIPALLKSRPISAYLDKRLVVFLEATDRDGALNELVDALQTTGKVPNRDEFFEAVMAREKIVSTGIGMGVSIPHAKLPNYEDFFIAVGVQKQGIAWNSLDGAPVRLIFLVGGPNDKQTQYLQILSSLTVALKDEERRDALHAVESPAALLDLFE